MTSGPSSTRWSCISWAPGGATSTRRRSGSTRRTSSASAVSPATRGWSSSPRWNACCGRRRTSLPAFEPLADSENPWVRALARLQLGKMRIVLGQGGRDADAYLEMALAEFRALGERFGISIALTELADRIAVRGEFAAACDHYEEAIAVVTEVGAFDDVIAMRSRQAKLYWLQGDRTPARPPSPRRSGARSGSPGRTRWPSWPWPRRNSPAGAATPRRPASSSAARGHPGRRRGAAEHPRGDTRPARLPGRRSRRGPYAPRGGLPGGVRGGARAPDRAVHRRGRGPGAAPRSVRAGRAAARGQRRHTRTAGSLPAGCGQDRAGRTTPPRRHTVRRGDAGGYADELVRAGRGHARFLTVSHAPARWMMMSPCRVRAWTMTLSSDGPGVSCDETESCTAPRSLLASRRQRCLR